MIFDTYNDVVTPAEAMRMLHVGRNTIYKLLKDKRIKSIRIGSKYLIPKNYICDFLAREANPLMNTGDYDIISDNGKPVTNEKEAC